MQKGWIHFCRDVCSGDIVPSLSLSLSLSLSPSLSLYLSFSPLPPLSYYITTHNVIHIDYARANLMSAYFVSWPSDEGAPPANLKTQTQSFLPSAFLSDGVVYLANWWFQSSQPLGIISGLKENFIKRYIVERTNKAEIRPEEQSEKTESCRENLWSEIVTEILLRE